MNLHMLNVEELFYAPAAFGYARNRCRDKGIVVCVMCSRQQTWCVGYSQGSGVFAKIAPSTQDVVQQAQKGRVVVAC